MKIKPVESWLLLKESPLGEEQFGQYQIIIPDTARSLMSLIIAEVLEVGEEAAEKYAIGDLVLFKEDSPALTRMINDGKQLLLLPAAHIVAKAEVGETPTMPKVKA